jgi:hypothetical protein
MAIRVAPNYCAINAVRDIVEPWIELWGGDEWGESMRSAHSAAHTSYGFTDEDCAIFAEKLLENILFMKEFWDNNGEGLWGYSFDEIDGARALADARAESTKARDYWLEGGNLKGDTGAVDLIAQLPEWLFEDSEQKECDHDWRIVPNVLIPSNPPQQELRCADCGAFDTRPHPNFQAGLPPKDPKDWEKA